MYKFLQIIVLLFLQSLSLCNVYAIPSSFDVSISINDLNFRYRTINDNHPGIFNKDDPKVKPVLDELYLSQKILYHSIRTKKIATKFQSLLPKGSTTSIFGLAGIIYKKSLIAIRTVRHLKLSK